MARKRFWTAFIKFVKDVSPRIAGISFPIWSIPLRNVQMGYRFYSNRKCGTKKQTAEHIITSCPIYHHPNGARDFSDVDKNLAMYPMETSPEIIGPSSSRASSPNEEEGNEND